MKRYFYLAVTVCVTMCALCMNSCSRKLQPDAPIVTGAGCVEWDMMMDAVRSSVNADGSGSFEEGDSVVVYARNLSDRSLRHYTVHLSGNGWEPEISWEEIGEEVEFTAWHMVPSRRVHDASQTSTEYQHTLSADQQGDGYRSSDLMCAKARVQAGNTVRLQFSHMMSRIKIVLGSDDASYTEDQLRKAVVQVNTPCRISFSLSEGTSGSCSDSGWVTPEKGEDNVRTVLVCPQSASDMPADDWIRVSVDGVEKSVGVPETLDGQPFGGLEPGKEITYRLNVKKGETIDDLAGTTRWIYGVKEPSADQWNYDHTQLAWTEGCGWFDCNKVDPSDVTSGGDGLMCWAAATSNLIHWWLQQNSGTSAVNSYTGPAAVPSDMLHSAVFQLFKDHFPNQGDYPLKAINWFFNGVFHKNMYDSDPVDPAAGFFREQLGTQTLGAEYSGRDMMRDSFNSIIRRALSSQQGVLFVVNLGKAWSTHAVTLWGVKFGEDGLIDTLYMVDNNDGRNDPRGTIRTMEVSYLPYSSNNPDLYPYVPNSVDAFTVRIESICTLSLGRQWVE